MTRASGLSQYSGLAKRSFRCKDSSEDEGIHSSEIMNRFSKSSSSFSLWGSSGSGLKMSSWILQGINLPKGSLLLCMQNNVKTNLT